MATHDMVIANQNGANTRSDLNNALSAIVSNNSSATEPSTTYAFMWWADTANDLLKQRNAADSAWINILTLSTGAPLGTLSSSLLSGTLPALDGSSLTSLTGSQVDSGQTTCKAWVNFNGTGTVAIRASYNVSSITDNGIGDYTVNFTTAMSNADYAYAGTCGRVGSGNYGYYVSTKETLSPTGSINIITAGGSGNKTDLDEVSIIVFGD